MFGNKPGWKLKVRVWVERNGEKVLGPEPHRTSGHIDRLHSISAAAKEMSMSYRRAWTLVASINESAGKPLVELTTGGAGGGGATLTEHGRDALRLYETLTQELARTADACIRKHHAK